MKEKSLKLNALLNIISQSLTIIFPLITFPYVARVLGNDEFGRYNFSASIVTYFQLFAAFGISTFAIREGASIRDDKKAISHLASDLFLFNILTCTASYVVLVLLVLFNPKVNAYSWLVLIQSLSMIFTLIGMDWVNNVFEDFLYITIRYIIIQLLALICIFLFVKNSSDTSIYCVILVLGSYGGNIINLFYIRKYVTITKPTFKSLKKYFIPLLILFINSLATTIYVNSDVTMIGFFYDDDIVGIYSFASKIYNILKYFINAAVVVAIPRLASVVYVNKKRYYELVEKVIYALIVFLFPISTGLFMLSKQVITIVGDKEYIDGYSSLMVLSFSLIFALLGSICTNCVLIIHKKEKRVLVSTIISACVNVLLNLLLIPSIGIIGAAFTTVFAELVNFVIQLMFIRKEIKIKIRILYRDIFSVLLGVVIISLICHFVSSIWNNDSVINCIKQVGLAVLLSCIFYLIVLIVLKNSFIMSLVSKFIYIKKVGRKNQNGKQ